jgi:1-deoxy-D-xylulose-5-phosphate synthase
MFSNSYRVYFLSGMAVARDIKGRRERVVAVISNWTTMSGQVYEAMSNAGYLDSNMVVILNDSRHSLLPKIEEGSKTSVNALSSTLSRLQSSKSFRRFREAAKVCSMHLFLFLVEKMHDSCQLA